MIKDKLIKTKYTLTRQSISERYVCKLKSNDCTLMSHFNVCPWFFKYYCSFKLFNVLSAAKKKRFSFIYRINLFLSCISKIIKNQLKLL